MIHNFPALADDIIKGFWHAGQNAAAASGGNTRLDPWDVVSTGLDLSASVAQQAHLWNLGPAIVIGLSALVILVVFALLAGVIAITLVETYVIINAAVIFMALAGFQFSAEIARHAIRYVIGIGAKLFALQLIIGVASAIFQNWSTQFNAAGTVATIPDALSLVALVVLVFYLANSVPSALMGIVTGAHGTGQSIGSMVAAGTTAMSMGANAAMTVGGGALKAAGGSINAAHGGAKLASEQLRDASLNGTAPTSKLERFGVAAGAAAANVAWAAAQGYRRSLGWPTQLRQRIDGRTHGGLDACPGRREKCGPRAAFQSFEHGDRHGRGHDSWRTLRRRFPMTANPSEIRNEADEASAASTCNFGVRRGDLTGLPSAAPGASPQRDTCAHIAASHDGHAQRQDICRGSKCPSRL